MKISIHMPNFNHGRYLRECIESVRAQTYPDWEMVVVDDGSTDDSWAILQDCARADARVVPLRFEANRGVHAAEAHALAHCTGDLLHPRASDNPLVSPTFFEKAVAALDRHPGAAVVFALTEGVDEARRNVLARWGAPQQMCEYLSPGDATREFFLSDYVAGEAIIQRADLLRRHGAYDAALGPYGDLFINEALPALYGGVFLNDVVSHTRLDASSWSRRQTVRAITEHSALMEKKFRALPLPVPPQRDWIVRYRERKLTDALLFRQQSGLADTLAKLEAELGGWPVNRMPAYLPSVRAHLSAMVGVVRAGCEGATREMLALYETIAGPLPPA